MIVHLLCFLMMMMVSVVICAPGQKAARQNVVQVDDDSKASEQVFRVVDSLGGGNLVLSNKKGQTKESLVSREDNARQSMVQDDDDSKAIDNVFLVVDPLGGGNLVLSDKKEQKNESLVSHQDNALSTLTVSAREDKPKQRHTSSNTLDPLGGGYLLRMIDPDSESHNFRTLELLVNYQDNTPQTMLLQGRVDKPTSRPSSSGTLDPIGGGNLLRAVDFDRESQNFKKMESFVKNQDDFQLAREDKSTPRPSSSGTLDPIGGGNLVKAVDPSSETQNFKEREFLFSYQDDIPLERKDKSTPRPSSSGTLDSIGGGNLLRAVGSGTEAQIFREMEFLNSNQGRQMMRLAREDKSSQRSAHALDSLGSGRPVGVVDPYRGNQNFRSLDRNYLLDSLDNYQGGEVLRVLDALTGSDLLSSLDSAERVAVLSALKKTHTKHPKRMLDSVSGWAFGESKRNFDEIDNVGFTGFAKKSPSPYYRKQYEALAKKNFDEIDRAGFETYNKRDFDEIDRTGFETFEKRDRKE